MKTLFLFAIIACLCAVAYSAKFCPAVFNPVCTNQGTHPNACAAKQSGLKVLHNGPCKKTTALSDSFEAQDCVKATAGPGYGTCTLVNTCNKRVAFKVRGMERGKWIDCDYRRKRNCSPTQYADGDYLLLHAKITDTVHFVEMIGRPTKCEVVVETTLTPYF